jgi:hypothetical protein
MNKRKIATTTEEWLKLPHKEIVPCKWYWPTGWYEAPFALMINDWDNWEKHIKKEYPIQYWLRENFQYSLRRFYNSVKDLKNKIINPRQKMRNALFTSKWVDLVELVPQFHFQAIIEFVETEKAFEKIVWDNSLNPKTTEAGIKLKEYYNYVKVERPLLLEKLSQAYENVEITAELNDSRYKEVDEIDKQIKTKDTELCIWVIQNRELLWT